MHNRSEPLSCTCSVRGVSHVREYISSKVTEIISARFLWLAKRCDNHAQLRSYHDCKVGPYSSRPTG